MIAEGYTHFYEMVQESTGFECLKKSLRSIYFNVSLAITFLDDSKMDVDYSSIGLVFAVFVSRQEKYTENNLTKLRGK